MTEFPAKTGRQPLPSTYFNLSWIAMVLLHFLFPIFKIISYPLNLIGIPSLLMGIWINLWTSNKFKKMNTTVKPFETPGVLVTDGFFHFSRHHMYAGMILILAGVGLLLGSLSPFLIFQSFMTVISYCFSNPEEKALRETFGVAYQDYSRQVRK